MGVVEIIFIVVMAIWFLVSLPVSQAAAPYGWATSWLPFIAVLLLGLHLFLPSLR